MCVDRLVDEAKAVGRLEQASNAIDDLIVIFRRQDAHDDRHGPYHARALVRAADRGERRTMSVVGVGRAEDVFASVLVCVAQSGLVLVTKMGDTEKRGDIGIILGFVSFNTKKI